MTSMTTNDDDDDDDNDGNVDEDDDDAAAYSPFVDAQIWWKNALCGATL